jgi:SAM-dependent methyltransferase
MSFVSKLIVAPRAGAFVAVVAGSLLATELLRAQAPAAKSAAVPAPEAVVRKFEFDHTLGTSQAIDPFGATPHEVVAQMLKLAGAGKDDVVYDLGSGDGRIPIAAAKQAGARGVGVELLPELIEQSRAAAGEAGVAERVQFIAADMFQCDLRPATVVTLYLYPRTSLKLRPKLLSELRPGARVVAYMYGIEGWPRDDEQPVEDPESYHDGMLYLWIVPANVSGTWQGSLAPSAGESFAFTLQLEQTFQKVSGKVVSSGGEQRLADVQLRGDTLRFSFALPDGERRVFVATASGHELHGQAEKLTPGSGSEPPLRRIPWQARRDPATQTAIDADHRR